tara:strand:- start:729 stop:1100 length:372 start_codon:yes stop_codon:yes gene_type:complete
MKKIFFLAIVFCIVAVNAQEVKNTNKKGSVIQTKITSLTFSVNSSADFKSINWETTKELFAFNSTEQQIQLIFKFDLLNSKNKMKGSFTVSGESKNIDNLIVKAKKGVKGLIKIIDKNKTNEN